MGDGDEAEPAPLGTPLGRLVLANVGDSRALLCRQGAVLLASYDHDLEQAAERQRCEASGGAVVASAGCLRLVPPATDPALLVTRGARHLTLNMSRALGHAILSAYGLTAEPDLYEQRVEAGDRLVLASDGLWDVLSNELVAHIAGYCATPAEAVTALYHEAMDHYALADAPADNVSLLVVYF